MIVRPFTNADRVGRPKFGLLRRSLFGGDTVALAFPCDQLVQSNNQLKQTTIRTFEDTFCPNASQCSSNQYD